MFRSSLRWLLASALLIAAGLGVALLAPGGNAAIQRSRGDRPARSTTPAPSAQAPSPAPAADIPFDGRRAYGYLKEIVAIGPRPSGSPGMRTQQNRLAAHFRQLGAKVAFQSFRARDPRNGQLVRMANLFVQWHPKRKQRVLLAAHYDTRPYPDRDPHRPRGRFVGANDGASGVALLMELAHHLPKLDCRYAVDFVLLDGEEYVFSDRDPYFLGSEFFARSYVANPPSFRYRWGVLLDMVADADLQIYQEVNSRRWPDTRPLVDDIWRVARQLGVREFIARAKYEIRDDHLKLRNIGGIPTCDIIDFDYPWWHTEGDLPDRCSADSLEKVGRVIVAWLQQAP